MNSPPSLKGKGVGGLGFALVFPHDVKSQDITQLYVREQNNPELLHRATKLEALPESWRDYFQEQNRRQEMR